MKRPEIINPHYQFLKKYDKKQWDLLNAELAKEGYYDKFRRTILRNKKKRIIDFNSWVRTCILRFMPWFTQEHFDSNTWPDVPKVAALKSILVDQAAS